MTTTTNTGVPERSLQNDLAYNEMTMGANGSVMSREEKQSLREKHGFCTECEGLPTLLYAVKKSKLNPLWVTKDPRAVAGECAGGVCFICHPDQDPHRGTGYRLPQNAEAQSAGPSRGPRPNFNASRNNRQNSNRVNDGRLPPEAALPAARGEASAVAPPSPTMGSSARRLNGNSNSRVARLPTASPRVTRTKTRSQSSFPNVFVPDVMLEAKCEVSSPLEAKCEVVNSDQSQQSQTSALTSSQRDSQRSNPGETDELPMVSENSVSNLSNHSDQRPPASPRSESSRPTIASKEASFSSNHSQQHSQAEHSQQSFGVASAGVPHAPSTAASNLSEQEVDGVIDGIDSLIQDMINIPGNAEVLASIILGTMNEHENIPAVQTYCLRMIWDTCKDSDENKDALMVAGAPAKILEAMKSFPDSPSVQEKGCGAIWSLGVSSSNRIVLIRARACQQISLAIKSFMSTESLVRTAIGALRTLSPESEARELLCSLGGPKFVSEAMSMHRECVSVQRDGCAFLSNCAVDIEKQVVKVVPFEELDAVVQAMANHNNEVSVMQGACFALKNYTHEESNCRSVRSCKGVTSLLEYAATFEASPGCMENAADILERLQMSRMMDESIEEQAYLELIRFSESESNKSEVQRRIVDFMNDFVWSPRMTAVGLEILRKTVNDDAPLGNQLFSSGAIRDILRFCQDLARDERVCSEGCGLVTCLASNVENHDPLLEVGASSFVFRSLETHYSDVGVAKNALEALSLLSASEKWFQEIKQQMSLVAEAHASHPTNDTVQISYSSILSLL